MNLPSHRKIIQRLNIMLYGYFKPHCKSYEVLLVFVIEDIHLQPPRTFDDFSLVQANSMVNVAGVLKRFVIQFNIGKINRKSCIFCLLFSHLFVFCSPVVISGVRFPGTSHCCRAQVLSQTLARDQTVA